MVWDSRAVDIYHNTPSDDARLELNPVLIWSGDGMTMTLDYVVTSGGLDPFSLRVEASPRLTIRSEVPLQLSKWIDHWVQPMQ